MVVRWFAKPLFTGANPLRLSIRGYSLMDRTRGYGPQNAGSIPAGPAIFWKVKSVG